MADLASVRAGEVGPKGPRDNREFRVDPSRDGPPLVPRDLASRIERAVGKPLPLQHALRDHWEEQLAGVFVELFIGQVSAPLHRAALPKHSGDRAGPAKRVEAAIVALKKAADALDQLPFMVQADVAPSLLSMLNRDAAEALSKAKRDIPRGRPKNAVQKRAIRRLLRLFIGGFMTAPRRTSGVSAFRRFIEAVWEIALTDCGMDPNVIGSQSAAWASAEHLLRQLKAQRQNEREIG